MFCSLFGFASYQCFKLSTQVCSCLSNRPTIFVLLGQKNRMFFDVFCIRLTTVVKHLVCPISPARSAIHLHSHFQDLFSPLEPAALHARICHLDVQILSQHSKPNIESPSLCLLHCTRYLLLLVCCEFSVQAQHAKVLGSCVRNVLLIFSAQA